MSRRRQLWTATSLRGLRYCWAAAEVDHPQRGAHALGGAVLEAYQRVHRDVFLAAIDRLDDVAVFFADDAAAHFSRPGQLAVVGVELLVEQQEACDPLRRRQRGVDRFDLLLQQRVDLAAG